MKLSVVLGTRPEVIKLAPVILAARARGHEVNVVFTGQHRNLALPLLKFFGIVPTLDLDVMTPHQSLSALSQRLLSRMDEHAEILRGDYLLVQGDTTSAWMASYWAFLHRIRVAHVEAGLRTYDLQSPFPEEANRQLIGRLAELHFAPTARAVKALQREGVSPKQIVQVGNSGIDALEYTLARLKKGDLGSESTLSTSLRSRMEGKRVILVTAHRRESFGLPFEELCRGLLGVADLAEDVLLVYPVHPNPQVRKPVEALLAHHPRILLCDPLSYVAFVQLMDHAKILLTDSGGVQEEGPTLRKPILVLREKTERPEGVKAGFAKLVGTDPKKIVRECALALRKGCQVRAKNPYGDGKASQRMIKVLEKETKTQRGVSVSRSPR